MRVALPGAILAILAACTVAGCGGHGHGGSPLPPLRRTALAAGADYASTVLADGPAAYYRLDDTSSSVADAGPNGLNGTAGASVSQSAAGLLAGSADTAMAFPGLAGSAGIVAVPQTPALQPASAVSLEVWLRFAAVPKTYSVVAAYGSDSSYAPYDLFFQSAGRIDAQFFTSAGVLDVVSTSALAINTTYHVVSTFDGTTGRLYVNGVQVSSGAKSGTLANYAPGFGFAIGDDAALSDPAFAGTVDEVAVYAGKTLTAQQVQTHYNAGLGSIVTPSPAPSATPSPTPPPPTPPPSPTPPPGPSSLQIVQSAAIISSLGATLSRVPANGDLLVAIGFNGKTNVSCATGWTAIRHVSARYDDGQSCYRLVSGDGVAIAPFAGGTPANVGGFLWELSGEAATAFIDANAGAEGAARTVDLTFAPAKPGDMILGAGAINAKLAAVTPSGFVQNFAGSPIGTTGFSALYAHKSDAGAGSQTVTWAFNSTTDPHPVTALMVAVAGAPFIATPTPVPTAAPADWTTAGYDIQRTGYDPDEHTLGASSFGTLHSLWSQPVMVTGGEIGEPVLASRVTVNGASLDVLYAGGQTGMMFAFDAASGATIWSKQLGTSSYSCGTFTGTFGIGGAPVIDRAKNRIYVGDGAAQVHAFDLATGTEAPGWPLTIASPSNLNFIYSGLTYNPANGMLYAETSTTCDISPWFGRIVAIDTAAARVTNTFFPAQGASGGGIWGFGGASIDPATNDVFIAVGNADTAGGASQTAGYSEQIVQLSPDVNTVLAHFYAQLPPSSDSDFGATPLLFQPPGCPPLVAAVNKSGLFVLYGRGTINAGPVQSIQMSITSDNGDFVGIPAYDPVTNYVYVALPASSGIYKPGLGAFSIAPDCTLNPAPVWNALFGADGAILDEDTPRSPIAIANGVLYVSDYQTSTTYAFDAATGAQLWTQSLSGKGIVGPIVANGHLYVGNISGGLTAWTP